MIRRYRSEILLVSVIVLVVSVYARWAYIPTFADRHVAASEEKYDFDVGDPGEWFSAWSLGDGQAYVLIAIDPDGSKLAEEVSQVAYRYARAGYGWLGWALSLGRDDFVPYALAIVGGLAVIGTFVLAVRLRPRLGPRSWLIVVNPALYIGFAGDTSEPLGILFLTLALASNSWLAAAALGFTRPSYLVALWGRWRIFLPGVAAAAAIVAYGVVALDGDLIGRGGGHLALPLVAYVTHPSVVGWLLAIAAIGTIAVGVRSRTWSWILSGAFVLCFGLLVLEEPLNAWRAAGFLPVLWAFGPDYDVETATTSRVGVGAVT